MAGLMSKVTRGHSQARRKHRAAFAGGLLALGAALIGAPAQAHGGSLPGTFRDGALYGQVVDTSGKPVADATVALQDRRGRVVAWTRTDNDGHYRLAANSLAVLDLETHHFGTLQSIGRGFVEVIKLPVGMAGVAVGAAANTVVGAVKAIDPIGTIKAAAVSAAEGNPLTLAQQAASDVSNLLSQQSQQTVRGNAASAIIYPTAKPAPPPGPQPGEAVVLVSAPQFKEYDGTAGTYCLEHGDTDSAAPVAGARAWLDTVQLAPESDPKATSSARDQAATLGNVTVSPAFAAAGSSMKVSVQLQAPTVPDMQIRVVARLETTHQITELLSNGNGTYSGTIWLDPGTPLGPTTLSIAAFTASPLNVSLPTNGPGDPFLNWVGGLDCIDAGKPYHFDPRVMASENRIDVKLMVLNPALETPQSGGQ